MFKYQLAIIDILTSNDPPLLTTDDYTIDLKNLTNLLKELCPGNFELKWKDPNKRMGLFDGVDIHLIEPVFENDYDRMEWMLRYE